MPRSYRTNLSLAVAALLLSIASNTQRTIAQDQPRPNILWITSEDNGPHLGCYGDEYATTPNLDDLAGRGVIYRTCWSNVPVCAPARTAIITGMYPTSLGAQHMRSFVRLPDGIRMYPQYLREAGYYCTNNVKEDYNVAKPGQVWDESSNKAHWKNRGEGQPFFAIFNHTISHESRIRSRPHEAVHDPAKVRLPEYHPDAPAIRQDWAQYYDRLTEMDALAGENLREIAEAGLADDTIVFYYGDHGSGMPRGKRSPCDSGMHVPLIVFIPEKFKHLRPDDYAVGGATNRVVSFVDLAPTVLSLCGIEPPANMQGHAFAGPHTTEPQEFIYGLRGRMDERYDMARSVTDGRYVYVRNYMPHRTFAQHVAYQHQTPSTQVWKRMFDAGETNEAQSHFWRTKPAEELYDLTTDPDEVQNLAESPAHRDALLRFRSAHNDWVVRTRDIGFLPEGEFHDRAGDDAPYSLAQNKQRYPLEQIKAAADRATMPGATLEQLLIDLDNDESAVRYWGATGILINGEQFVPAAAAPLRASLTDASPYVRIVAAEALARLGPAEHVEPALEALLDLASVEETGYYISLAAANALDALDEKAAPAVERIAALPRQRDDVNQRMRGDIGKVLEKALADLK